jgi:hypothetical protein
MLNKQSQTALNRYFGAACIFLWSKNVKINIDKTIILHIVLYGCET